MDFLVSLYWFLASYWVSSLGYTRKYERKGGHKEVNISIILVTLLLNYSILLCPSVEDYYSY